MPVPVRHQSSEPEGMEAWVEELKTQSNMDLNSIQAEIKKLLRKKMDVLEHGGSEPHLALESLFNSVIELDEGPERVAAIKMYNAVVCLFLAAKSEPETRNFLCEFFKGVTTLFSPERKLICARLAAADALYDQIEEEKTQRALEERRAQRKEHMEKMVRDAKAKDEAKEEAKQQAGAASGSASASKRSRG